LLTIYKNSISATTLRFESNLLHRVANIEAIVSSTLDKGMKMIDLEESVQFGTEVESNGSYGMKCQCTVCNAELNVTATESELHLFLGIYQSNQDCDLEEFEQGLEYESVLHWDIGYCDEARYYSYHDMEGNAVAWYDNANSRGYK